WGPAETQEKGAQTRRLPLQLPFNWDRSPTIGGRTGTGGIDLALERVERRVEPALERSARRQAESEEPFELVDRIRDHDDPVVVEVGSVLTGKRSAGGEEPLERAHRVGEVDRSVRVRVAAAERDAGSAAIRVLVRAEIDPVAARALRAEEVAAGSPCLRARVDPGRSAREATVTALDDEIRKRATEACEVEDSGRDD